MSTQDHKALLSRVLDSFNKGEAAVIAVSDELFAPNFVYHPVTGDVIRGLKDYKPFVKEFLSAFPDAHYTVEDMLFEGDKGAVRITITATHKGPLMGIPATNKKMVVEMNEIYRMAVAKSSRYGIRWIQWA